jgi:hypothetical protein
MFQRSLAARSIITFLFRKRGGSLTIHVPLTTWRMPLITGTNMTALVPLMSSQAARHARAAGAAGLFWKTTRGRSSGAARGGPLKKQPACGSVCFGRVRTDGCMGVGQQWAKKTSKSRRHLLHVSALVGWSGSGDLLHPHECSGSS